MALSQGAVRSFREAVSTPKALALGKWGTGFVVWPPPGGVLSHPIMHAEGVEAMVPRTVSVGAGTLGTWSGTYLPWTLSSLGSSPGDRSPRLSAR